MVDVERKGVEDERSTDRLCTASQSAHFRGRPIAVAAHFRGNTVVGACNVFAGTPPT